MQRHANHDQEEALATARDLHSCEMELQFLDITISHSSLAIQRLMRYQATVYSKYTQTQQLRFKCQYNNMNSRIHEQCTELRLLELRFVEMEQRIQRLKQQARIADKRRFCPDADSSSSSSSSSDSSSSSSSPSGSSSPLGARQRLVLSFGESGLDSSDEENVEPPVNDFLKELEQLGLDISDDEEDDVPTGENLTLTL